jgi:hypothetical protein
MCVTPGEPAGLEHSLVNLTSMIERGMMQPDLPPMALAKVSTVPIDVGVVRMSDGLANRGGKGGVVVVSNVRNLGSSSRHWRNAF